MGWITLAITSWEQGVAEVGYALTTSAQGQGLMAPALAQLVAELFGRTAVERLEARCSVDNVASARTIEVNGGVLEDIRGTSRRYWVPAGTSRELHT